MLHRDEVWKEKALRRANFPVNFHEFMYLMFIQIRGRRTSIKYTSAEKLKAQAFGGCSGITHEMESRRATGGPVMNESNCAFS